MRKFLAHFISSLIPNRNMRHTVRKTIRNFRIKHLFIKKTKYDFVFSMGEACFVADCLKLRNLRKYSGPFDWMYASDFETRFKIFINEFEDYFNKSDLQLIDKNETVAVYKNIRTGLIYNHDFRANQPFDTEYQLVYDKYARRIKRLIDCAKSGGRILICYCEMRTASYVDTASLFQLLDYANMHFSNNIDLAYFRHNPNMKIGTAKMIKQTPHLRLFEYYGSNGGNIDANPKEEIIICHNIADNLAFARVIKNR